MAANELRWTFEQLEGPRKTLVLEDHSAPHGGPRRDPVVTPGVVIRNDANYYTDRPNPTRIIFQPRAEPFVLRGRFRDRHVGPGYARARVREVMSFVLDRQQVLITWDDLVLCTGMIERFTPEIESGAEIAWELEVQVDEHEQFVDPAPLPAIQTAPSVTAMIEVLLSDVEELTREPVLLKGDIFDALDSLISSVNTITAFTVTAAQAVGSFANAPFTALRRLRFGLEQLGTAVVLLRQTYDDLTTGQALESALGDGEQKFYEVQAKWSVSMTEALRLIVKADEVAAESERGRTLAFHIAGAGETWESISLLYYDSADRADELREANGVEAGMPPQVNVSYRIPI